MSHGRAEKKFKVFHLRRPLMVKRRSGLSKTPGRAELEEIRGIRKSLLGHHSIRLLNRRKHNETFG